MQQGPEGGLELLGEHFPGIVWAYEVQSGRLSYINQKACDLLGWEPEEISRWKTDWTQMIWPDDREMASKEIQVCLRLGHREYETFDCRLLQKPDGLKYFRIQGSVLHRDRDRNPVSLLFFAQEAAARASDSAAKEIDDFAYAASHDLQEPLRKIVVLGERLRQKFDGALGQEGQAYLTRITGATEHMRRLIDSLLEFSRVTPNRDQYALTDLNEILDDAQRDLRDRIVETGASILCGHLPSIVCNRFQVRQLFGHILSNSLKFRDPERPLIIEVRSDVVPAEEREKLDLPKGPEFHHIGFADNGIGFDQAYAEKIFTIFQRLNGKSEFPGTGIGLAICKKIAGQHGGMILARSTAGSGAHFSVFLPAEQASQ